MTGFRSSHQRCSMKKGALRNFTKFTGKCLCQSLFFDKLAGLRPATLLKKRLRHRCFPVNFAKFLRTPFLQNTPGRLLVQFLYEIQHWPELGKRALSSMENRWKKFLIIDSSMFFYFIRHLVMYFYFPIIFFLHVKKALSEFLPTTLVNICHLSTLPTLVMSNYRLHCTMICSLMWLMFIFKKIFLRPLFVSLDMTLL